MVRYKNFYMYNFHNSLMWELEYINMFQKKLYLALLLLFVIYFEISIVFSFMINSNFARIEKNLFYRLISYERPKKFESFSQEQIWKLPRIYLNHSLIPNSFISLNFQDSHYLLNVMRMKRYNFFRAFNSLNGEYLCKLENIQKSKKKLNLDVIVTNQIKPPCQYSEHFDVPIVFFAPLKKTRMKILLEKACELGVKELIPVLTHNSNLENYLEAKDFVSYNKILTQATEQSERMDIPKLYQPIEFSQLFSSSIKLTDPIIDDKGEKNNKLKHLNLDLVSIFVCRERGTIENSEPILKSLNSYFSNPKEERNQASFFIGPEGGFTTNELNKFSHKALRHRFNFISLGEDVIYRSETAILFALSVWNSLASIDH